MLPPEVLEEARRLSQEAASEWQAAKTDSERRGALRKNLDALRKIGQHLIGEEAALLAWKLDAALNDLETGRRPSWLRVLKPPGNSATMVGDRGRHPSSASRSAPRRDALIF